MHESIQLAIQKQDSARSYRKKGDALRKVGREDAAQAAYQSGVTDLLDARELLRPWWEQLASMTPPLSGDPDSALREIVELCGALGGLNQRLGSLGEALASYSEGSDLEERFGLSSTYNRLNAVKCALLSGQKRLAELIPKVQALANLIEGNLRIDKSLGDSGWALADLGDCLALLGRVEEASQAYAKFIAKAEIKSPERTLDVLKEIASRLQAAADPDAQRVQAAIAVLQARLVAP